MRVEWSSWPRSARQIVILQMLSYSSCRGLKRCRRPTCVTTYRVHALHGDACMDTYVCAGRGQ